MENPEWIDKLLELVSSKKDVPNNNINSEEKVENYN